MKLFLCGAVSVSSYPHPIEGTLHGLCGYVSLYCWGNLFKSLCVTVISL
jgi:hypothetical protein